MGKSSVGKFLIVLSVVLLVFISGLLFFQQTVFTPEKYIEAPSFAYMECLPSVGGEKSISRTFDGSVQTITCSSDNKGALLGLNDGCSVVLQAPNQGFTLKRDYAWRIQREGSVSYSEQGTVDGGIGGYSGEELTLILGRNDVLQVAFGSVLFDNPKSEGEKYTVRGNSFQIFNFNDLSATTGQPLTNTRTGSCVLEDNYYKGLEITYKDPSIVELQNRDKGLSFKNLNQPYGSYTYFKSWTPLPAFGSQIEMLDGKEVYCMDRKLFKTLDIVVGGKSYKIVNYDKSGYVKSVACCNGEETPDKLCVNHEFIPKEKAECDLSKGIFCPQSTYQPFGVSQYKRFACESNKCVADVIDVKCNDDSDCVSGEVCAKASNPENNKCVQGGSGAGSEQARVVKVSFWDDFIKFIPWIIGGLFGLVILGIVLSKKKKGGKK